MQRCWDVSMRDVCCKYLRDVEFEEIQHIPPEFKSFEGEVSIQEGCLLISYDAFSKYYSNCAEVLKSADASAEEKRLAADLLLVMNGENEKAWNYKRSALNAKELDLKRELKFNAAICMKFKKSSCCYDFRLQLIKSHGLGIDPLSMLQSQHRFVSRVFQRFHRNTPCWNYRLRLYSYLTTLCSQKEQFETLELDLIKSLCEANVHDYSAFWYRFNMVRHRLESLKQIELEWVDSLIALYSRMYSEDEEAHKLYSLRTYRSWLLRKK